MQWCDDTLNALDDSVADVIPLRVEASHRCFYRVQTQRQSLVLMDSPPALERNAQFVMLAEAFGRQGVPVPQILAAEENRGFYLMTDLGDTHLEDLYDTPVAGDALQAAINMLPTLAATEHEAIEPYTRARLHMELDLFSQWFAERLLRHPLDAESWQHSCALLVESADLQPKCCVHRDYHCRNLLYNNGQLGIVDFQDALRGPILYDIASLLRDCYYVFDESTVDHWLDRFVQITPALKDKSADQTKRSFDWLALQRQLKAVGIFARLHLRDQKSSHLGYIPPLLQRIRAVAAQYSELQGLEMQLKDCIEATNHTGLPV